jgi:hypothetical protein
MTGLFTPAIEPASFFNMSGTPERCSAFLFYHITESIMPYNITVMKSGEEIPLPFYKNCEHVYLTRDFMEIHTKYPKWLGYSISVTRVGSAHPPYNREEYLEILTKSLEEKLQAFYVQSEFEAFIAQKERIAINELDRGDWYDDLENYPNIDYVIQYPDHYCILEVHRLKGMRTRDFKKYQIPFPWFPDDPIADTIEELEPILYLIYLGDGT